MDAPVLQRAEAHGKRDVGLLGREAGGEGAALQRGLTVLQRFPDAGLEAVDRLAEGLALLARQGAELGHQLGHAPLLAERSDAYSLDGGKISRSTDFGEKRVLQGGDFGVLCHSCQGRGSDPSPPFILNRTRNVGARGLTPYTGYAALSCAAA